MSTARAIVTKPQLDQAYKEALEGYTKAYGQVHDTPDGKYCWAGRIDRAYALAAKAEDEVNRRRMQKAIASLISLAEKDFIAGERANADYVDVCNSLGVTAQVIDPNCQCEYCQRVPRGAELLFSVEAFNGQAVSV